MRRLPHHKKRSTSKRVGETIEAYKASGLTMVTWCSANQVNLEQLKYWTRKLCCSLSQEGDVMGGMIGYAAPSNYLAVAVLCNRMKVVRGKRSPDRLVTDLIREKLSNES